MNSEYNLLSLKLRVTEGGQTSLVPDLFVDDVHLGPIAVVDMRMLAKSVQTSGQHWIFTCGCGVPMCAGIHDPISVRHGADFIEWHFSRLDALGGGDGLDDDEYARRNADVLFRFDPETYQRVVESCLSEIWSTFASITSGGSPDVNYASQDICGLTTKLFSDRDCFLERRLIAREIIIHATDGVWITVDRIPFTLEELLLPDELVSESRHFESLECFPNSPSDLESYEAFLDAGRKYGCKLKLHAGSQCSVKLWYRYGPLGNPDVWSITEDLR